MENVAQKTEKAITGAIKVDEKMVLSEIIRTFVFRTAYLKKIVKNTPLLPDQPLGWSDSFSA